MRTSKEWRAVVLLLAGLLAWNTGEAGTRDGVGIAAGFNKPGSIAADGQGNLYVADADSHTIRKISAAGLVTTFAGAPGVPGHADGPGAAARFNFPFGIATDRAGNVYVADAYNKAIRKISPAGVVSTVAGAPHEYVGHDDGIGAAARFNQPSGIAVDNAGNIYVADSYNATIRKISPAGVVTTFAGTAGKQDCSTNGMRGSEARFVFPTDLAIDGSGNVYVSDPGAALVRKITPDGMVSTLAGSVGKRIHVDGIGTAASFIGPGGITVDSAGNVYVADGSTIRKISPEGVVKTVAGDAGKGGNPNDDLVFGNRCAPVEATEMAVTPETERAAEEARAALRARAADPALLKASDIVVDQAGDMYIAERTPGTIRKITPQGEMAIIAGHLDADSYGLQTGDVIYATGSSVKLRQWPSSRSSVISTLPIGAAVRFVRTLRQPAGYWGKNPNCIEFAPPEADVAGREPDDNDWVCIYADFLGDPISGEASFYAWAAADLFGPEESQLDALLAQYDRTPKEDQGERRKWAERAFALDPGSAPAQRHLTEALAELHDGQALAAVDKTIALYQLHQPVIFGEDNPLVFIYDGSTIEPFAEIEKGVIKGWGVYTPGGGSTRELNRGFYNRERFYYVYSGGRSDGIAVTTMQFSCEHRPCPRKVLVRNIDPTYDSEEEFGIATNFPLPVKKRPTPEITEKQREILARMVNAEIQSVSSEAARQLLLSQMADSSSWASTGQLTKDGGLFLIGSLKARESEGRKRSRTANLHASLLVIAEQQADGSFRQVKSPSSGSLTDYGCAPSAVMDVDGDGTDEIILTCKAKEDTYNYGLIKRHRDHWERQF